MTTSPLVLKSYELTSKRTIVVVQSLAGSNGAVADWGPSVAFLKAVDVERKRRNLQVRLMAFSDGGQPSDEARMELEETFKRWKMAIIIHELNSFGGRILQRVMNFRIQLTSVPARVFSPIQVEPVFDYMELNTAERSELKGKITEYKNQSPGHLAVAEFTGNLPGNLRRAANG